jgi:hypothetical protein
MIVRDQFLDHNRPQEQLRAIDHVQARHVITHASHHFQKTMRDEDPVQ